MKIEKIFILLIVFLFDNIYSDELDHHDFYTEFTLNHGNHRMIELTQESEAYEYYHLKFQFAYDDHRLAEILMHNKDGIFGKWLFNMMITID